MLRLTVSSLILPTVHEYDGGSGAGEEPYAQDTQGDAREGGSSAQPLQYFFVSLFQCLFLFSFWQNKVFQHVSH